MGQALFLLFITLLHGALFTLDEHYFHRKRGLKRPELLNSLLDGTLFIGALIIPIFTKYSYWWEKFYIAMALASCLSIAKNEFFYKHLNFGERFVHSLLYVLHPIILYGFYISWRGNYFHHYTNIWMVQLLYLALGFKTITYQIIYWNYIYEPDSSVGHIKK